MSFVSGFVAIIGRPNAGKSSLLNSIIKEKVSIISPKPQTTRNNILGIYNSDHSQIVFVDTPGINSSSSGLDNFMQKSIKGAVTDVNLIVLVVDITKGLTKQDKNLIDNYYEKKIPLVLVLSKVDLVKKEEVVKFLQNANNLVNKCEIVPLSSLKKINIDRFIQVVEKYLPQTSKKNKFFDDDMFTDKSLRFLCAEIIREKALYLLNDEIPHGIAVLIEKYEEEENIVNIDASIICEKQSHKPIILGNKGQMLKKIGHNSRVSIQKLIRKKVMLNIFVKVKPNWKNNLEFLDTLGYNINGI